MMHWRREMSLLERATTNCARDQGSTIRGGVYKDRREITPKLRLKAGVRMTLLSGVGGAQHVTSGHSVRHA